MGNLIDSHQGFIFDLDGTIYRSHTLTQGSLNTITTLRKMGKTVRFLSNNPLKTRGEYARKLTDLGIPCTTSDVINSSFTLCEYLKTHHPASTIFCVGEASLKGELKKSGLHLSEDIPSIDLVVISFDRTFHYKKLNIACQAIKRGARVIATNADKTCPTEDGEIPDAGCLIAAIEACTGKKVRTIVGKPSKTMIEIILKSLNLKASQCVMVGDRLQTDIKMGNVAGMQTVLVLTGITNRTTLKKSKIKPDYVIDNAGELLIL